MKNAKNVNYWQVDNKVKNIFERKGVVILPSFKAWEMFKWSKDYFKGKPKEGYFVWVREQTNFPLSTCVSIAAQNTKQNLQNLLVVDEGLNVRVQGVCNALDKNLCGVHKAQGKIILKKGSSLKYEHIHSWGKEDVVEPRYEFLLEKDSKLSYIYKTLFTPKKLKINTSFTGLENSTAIVKLFSNCLNTKVKIEDVLVLKEKGASGIIELRLVGRKNSKVKAKSTIITEAQTKGHLDCQGLLVDESSEISLVPELVCKNKDAQITHEASIGKISEEELNYLRMRGLSEKEAINLIINGFLEL